MDLEPQNFIDNERMQKLSDRVTTIVAACLAVVVLVMAIGFVLLVGVAAESSKAETRQQVLNDELAIELKCRSISAAEFAILQGELDSLIAEGLAAVASDEDLRMTADSLREAAESLRRAAADRRNSVTTCNVDGSPDGVSE